MLKLVIVEDNEIDMNTLENVIDWTSYGIEVCGTAYNGEVAFNLVEKFHPDILVTDIMMPVRDGLWLTKEVAGKYPETDIIFITAHEDFSFAKAAIDVNAYQYLLKPYDIRELREVVRKVAAKCYREKNKNIQDERLRLQVLETLPLLREKFLKELMYDLVEDNDLIFSRIEFLGLDFLKYDTTLLVLEADDYEAFREQSDIAGIYLFKYKLLGIISGVITEFGPGNAFETNDNEFVVLINTNTLSNYKKMVSDFADELAKNIYLSTGFTVTVGIGGSTSLADGFYETYKRAVEAMRHKLYLDKGSIIWAEDIGGGKPQSFPNVQQYESEIVQYVKVGDIKKVQQQIDLLFELLYHNTAITASYIRSICIRLIISLSMTMAEMNDSLRNVMEEDESSLLEKLMRFETIPDICQWIKSVFRLAAEYIVKRQTDWNLKTVEKMKEIVEKKYFEDISVDDIANGVYLSAGYATTLFRKYTGDSLIKYVIKLRVEKAKELLRDESVKIYEVCQRVGYTNIAYFCSIFKNHVGLSPREYRSSIVSEE